MDELNSLSCIGHTRDLNTKAIGPGLRRPGPVSPVSRLMSVPVVNLQKKPAWINASGGRNSGQKNGGFIWLKRRGKPSSS